jgi:hypothetical protein
MKPYKTHPVEWRAYYDARNRCTNPNCTDFPNYGGRGIKFLFTSFEEFFAELGKRPSRRMLDRIENDGHYAVGNVRWATRRQSIKNQRHPKGRKTLKNFSTFELLAELAKRKVTL